MSAPMIEVAHLHGMTLFVQETPAGGHAFWTDDVGGGQCILDTSTVDMDVLRFVLGNHVRLIAQYALLRNAPRHDRQIDEEKAL